MLSRELRALIFARCQIDLAKTFEIAKQAGFRGYHSMEFDQEGDPLAGTKFLVEQSLKYLA